MKHAGTILVVDDEASVADGLRLTLESAGYSVRIAGGVHTAVEVMAQAEAHAAIVDLNLPDGNGLDLTREIRTRYPLCEVLVITAYGSVRKAMELTQSAGAFYVLEKPFDADEVVELVRKALEHRRLVAENSIEETLKLPLAEVEKRHIQRVLASTGGNKTRAARILGIDTKTLYNKLKSYKSSEAVARKRMLGQSNSMML